jgi:integrase
MTIRFTERALNALAPPEGKDRLEFDSVDRGLAVRVTRNSKTFGFKRGGYSWVTIGRYPAKSLADARKAARSFSAQLDKGEDPGAARRLRRAHKGAIARGEVLTLAGAVEGYIEKNPRRAGKPHLNKIRRELSAVFAPILKRPFEDLAFEDFEDCLEAVKDLPGKSYTASTQIQAVTRWAAAKYRLVNPLADRASELPGAVPSREVYLSGDDMRKVFRVAGTLAAPVGPLFQFDMLTVLRRNEAARTKRSEFDEHLTKLEISSGRMKGGEKARRHYVPIVPQVRKLIERLERHQGSDFLFTHNGGVPATGFSRYKKLLDQALADAGVVLPKFRIHDWRRSFVTWAQEHNDDFDFDAGAVADRCLGHVIGGKIQRTYNAYEFKKEKRVLMAAWADHLTGEEARQSDADIVGVEFEEVIRAVERAEPESAPSLPGPKPKLAAQVSESEPSFDPSPAFLEGLDKLPDFPTNAKIAHLAFNLLQMVASDPKVVTASKAILQRSDSLYRKKYFEIFESRGLPEMAGQCVVAACQRRAVMRFLWAVSPDGPNDPEEASKVLGQDLKKILGKAFIRDGDPTATAFARAVFSSHLTRWMLRTRKIIGSDAQPIDAVPIPTRSAA